MHVQPLSHSNAAACQRCSAEASAGLKQSPAGTVVQALAVAAGGMHTLCLATNNHLYSWGVNDEAALGRNAGGEPWSKSELPDAQKPSDQPHAVTIPVSAGSMVAVTAGDSHSTALTSRGQVLAWGTFRDDAGVMGFSASDRFMVRIVMRCVAQKKPLKMTLVHPHWQLLRRFAAHHALVGRMPDTLPRQAPEGHGLQHLL